MLNWGLPSIFSYRFGDAVNVALQNKYHKGNLVVTEGPYGSVVAVAQSISSAQEDLRVCLRQQRTSSIEKKTGKENATF